VEYHVPPTSEELNTAVGFATDVMLSPADQIELLRAHIQLSLSVSPATARYLSDGLGLQVIETANAASAPTAAAVGSTASAPTANAASDVGN